MLLQQATPVSDDPYLGCAPASPTDSEPKDIVSVLFLTGSRQIFYVYIYIYLSLSLFVHI